MESTKRAINTNAKTAIKAPETAFLPLANSQKIKTTANANIGLLLPAFNIITKESRK